MSADEDIDYFNEEEDLEEDTDIEDELEFDEEAEAIAEGEADDEDKELTKIEEEYLSEQEEEDDLTDFQKMLIIKQKQDFKTPNRLTKYELAALIGFRAQQIAEGAPPYVDVGNLSDPSAMASKELDEGLMPFVVERPLPSIKIGKFSYEVRTLNELINVNHLM